MDQNFVFFSRTYCILNREEKKILRGKKVNPKAHISNLYITVYLPYLFPPVHFWNFKCIKYQTSLDSGSSLFFLSQMKNKTKPQQVSSKLENYLSFQNFRLALQLFISFSRTFRHPEQRNDNELLQIWKQEGLLLEYFTAQYIAALKHEMFIFLNGGWSDFNVHIRKKKGKTILHNVFNNSLGFFFISA